MKYKLVTLIFCFFIALSAPSVFAETLTISAPASVTEAGGTFTANITVNDSSNVLGAAFTVEYDTTALVLTDIVSSFFGTFTAQNISPTSVTVGGVSYDQPLVSNDVTSVGTRIAAARAAKETDPAKKTLFTLTFAFQNGAVAGDFPITIMPTTLTNTTAGYSASGETVNLLIGYDSTTTPPTYPVLLSAANYASSTTPVTVSYSPDATFTLDIDGNGQYDASTDGALIYRYLSNFHVLYATAWTNGVIAADATRSADEVKAYLATGNLDIDGNGQSDAATDGALIYRYLSNFHVLYATAWTNGVIAGDATRSADEVKAFLTGLTP